MNFIFRCNYFVMGKWFTILIQVGNSELATGFKKIKPEESEEIMKF